MTTDELEAEIVRLRRLVDVQSDYMAGAQALIGGLERRLIQQLQSSEAVTARVDSLLTDIRDIQRKVRWIIARARGEEEATA